MFAKPNFIDFYETNHRRCLIFRVAFFFRPTSLQIYKNYISEKVLSSQQTYPFYNFVKGKKLLYQSVNGFEWCTLYVHTDV